MEILQNGIFGNMAILVIQTNPHNFFLLMYFFVLPNMLTLEPTKNCGQKEIFCLNYLWEMEKIQKITMLEISCLVNFFKFHNI